MPLILHSRRNGSRNVLVTRSPTRVINYAPLTFLNLRLFRNCPCPFLLKFLRPHFYDHFLVPVPIRMRILVLILILVPILLRHRPLFRHRPLLLNLPLRLVMSSLAYRNLLRPTSNCRHNADLRNVIVTVIVIIMCIRHLPPFTNLLSVCALSKLVKIA